MEEIIISVYLPAVAVEYECRISNQMKVKKDKLLIKEQMHLEKKMDMTFGKIISNM